MPPGILLIETIDPGITRITIDRPKALNALNSEILKELLGSLKRLSSSITLSENSTKLLIIRGAGEQAFVAGADIKEFKSADNLEIERYIELGQKVMTLIQEFPIPTIAQVKGYCLGGGMELACACDFIICSSNSKLGYPEIGLGLVPGFGGTQRTLQRVSLSALKKLIYLGTPIQSQEALQIGLVDIVFDVETFEEDVLLFAKNLAKKAPLALRAAKKLIEQSYREHNAKFLPEEIRTFLNLFESEDANEGIAAFLESREPKFRGR